MAQHKNGHITHGHGLVDTAELKMTEIITRYVNKMENDHFELCPNYWATFSRCHRRNRLFIFCTMKSWMRWFVVIELCGLTRL